VPRAPRRGPTPLLLAAMIFSAYGLWIGVPVGWLWIAGQISRRTDAAGTGPGVALFGAMITLAMLTITLGWLSQRHREARVARGKEDLGQLPLEVVMILSAFSAVVALAVWFFFFAGSSLITPP